MAAPVMTRHEGVQALGPSRRGLRLADGHQSKPVQQLAFGDLVCFYGDLEKCQKTPMLFLYGIQARPGKGGCGTSCSTESDFAKSLKPFQVATAVVYIQTGWEDEELTGSTYLVAIGICTPQRVIATYWGGPDPPQSVVPSSGGAFDVRSPGHGSRDVTGAETHACNACSCLVFMNSLG